LPVQRHYGSAFGFGADLLHFPEQDTTVIVLLNAPNLSATNLSEGIARRVLEKEMQQASPAPLPHYPLSRQQVRDFGRIWRSSETGGIWTLTPKSPGFVITTLGDLNLKLRALSETELVATQAQAQFRVTLQGKTLLLEHANGRQVELEQMSLPPQDLAPNTDFEGEYGSEPLAATIHLKALPDGRLKLEQKSPLLELAPFMPLAPNVFFSDSGARIDFHRDEMGKVSGLSMHTNRSWDLEFERLE
jgi:hypothetical protein